MKEKEIQDKSETDKDQKRNAIVEGEKRMDTKDQKRLNEIKEAYKNGILDDSSIADVDYTKDAE